MLLSSTTLNGAVSNDSNNNITMSVGNTVIANVNSSGIFFESGKKAIYTGAVLQVVNTNVTGNFSVASGSFVHATNHSLSITTVAANSKIILFCNTPLQLSSTVAGTLGATTFRSSLDSYSANIGETINVNTTDAGGGWLQSATMHSVHSPSQAAGTAITYRVYVRCSASSLYFPDPWGYGSFSFNFMAMEIAA
jgi:hypothetical protein